MKYASQINGLPVISFETGERFEKIQDIIFDTENNQVLAFLTDQEGLFSDAHVIRFDAIKSIGDDALIVPNKDVEINASKDEQISQAIEGYSSIKGKTVMTEDGKNLGSIADMEIDEISGRITGYQTSGGIFADMYKGKPVVPAPMTIKIGNDVVFVPNSTAELMESHIGGLKAAGHSVADKVGDLKDQSVAKGQEVAGTVKENVSNLKDNVQATATSDTTHDKLDMAKEEATSFLQQVKEKAVELKDQAAQKVEDGKINGALGKPASRVVLDKDDKVILNVGDIITHEAVEKARQAGELSVLLSSVYSQEPELTTEDMKAKPAQPDSGSTAGHI